jgi:hypothetical protein
MLVPTAQIREVYGALAQRLYLVFMKKLELGKAVAFDRGLLVFSSLQGKLNREVPAGKSSLWGIPCRKVFAVPHAGRQSCNAPTRFNVSVDAEFFMKKLNLEPKEVVRRFLISSAFESRQVIIVAPIESLLFRRVAYYPYTHGNSPWEAICDLSKFADTTVATTASHLHMICRLAECSMRRYDHRLQLYLHPSPPLMLVSDREAIRGDVLVFADEEEYKNIVAEAKEIIEKSKQVDYGMYLELLDKARR